MCNNISELIFQNAISAIQLGVEDYLVCDKQPLRVYSAIRNLYAGVLLLFKSHLAYLSQKDNEALIKANVLPKLSSDGQNVSWFGTGKKTIDFKQIKERYSSLKIEVDWRIVEDLQKYRNDIEHYYSRDKLTKKVLEEYFSKIYSCIDSFLVEKMHRATTAVFSQKVRETFISINNKITNEEEKNDIRLSELNWYNDATFTTTKSFMCPKCGNFRFDINSIGKNKEASLSTFKCTNCGTIFTYQELMKEVIDNAKIFLPFNSEGVAQFHFTKCEKCGEISYDAWFGHICYLCGHEEQKCKNCGKCIGLDDIPTFEKNGQCKECNNKQENKIV